MAEKEQDQLDKILQFRILAYISLLTILIGVVFYHLVEHLSWLDSAYFTVITLATVGYGDITPHTAAGKIFTIFYVLTGIGVLIGFANAVIERTVKKRMKKITDRRKTKTSKTL